MSSLIGVEISGIRSFGLDEPKQRLKFYTPLTLILGQNGCGKTTIIESLKYITTGDAPPGCGKGNSFVHDPKLAKETQVRGQIKLLFKSVQGTTLTSTRSLEATQKIKKLECKTIDATIARRNYDGTSTSISSKCVDFEFEMVNALGVSKAILNNVIFCHQEEANWPLDEAKKVKEKFDAIFSATRYIKCLDELRKKRKSLKDQVKVDTEILKEMEKLKILAESRRKELQKQEESLASLKDRQENLQRDQEPLVRKLNDIRRLIDQLAEIKNKYCSKKELLKSLRKAQDELRAGQHETIKCSDLELRRMIDDFQRDVDEKERKLSKVGSDVRQVENDIKDTQREIKNEEKRKTELEFDYSNHQKNFDSRNQNLKNVVVDHNFSDFKDIQEFDDDRASSVLSQLVELIKVSQNNVMARKRDFEKEESKIQVEIDTLRRKEAALEQEIKSKGKQIEESAQKLRQNKKTLKQNELEFSGNSLDSIKSELEQVERDITKQEGILDIKQTKDEIEEIRSSKRGVERQLEDNKRIVNKMNRQADARSKLDIHVEEQRELKKKIQLLKRRHGDELEHLLGEIPEENVKNKFDACTQSLRQRSMEYRYEKERLNKLKTKLDANIESNTNLLNKKEQDIKDLDRKIMQICQGEDLDKALEKSKKQKEDLTRERGDLSSSITVLNRFTEKLKQHASCPLCHRDFSKQEEVNQLIEELETKVSTVPTKLNNVKVKLEMQEKLYDQMVGLKPQLDQAKRLTQEAEKIKEQIQKDCKEAEKINIDLENNTELLELTVSDEETARTVQNDVVTIDNNMKKIKQLQEQIDDLKSTLGSADSEMSMEEAMKQQKELDDEMKRYQNQETDLQDKLGDHKDKLQSLKDRKIRLSSLELELKTKLQETEKLKEDISNLELDRIKLEEELEKAKIEVAPFKFQIDGKSEEKRKKTMEKDQWTEKEINKVQTIREKSKTVNELQRAILSYKQSGKENRLKEKRQVLARLEDNMASLGTRKKSLEDQHRQLERDLINQKERKRNLDDEKKIREKEEEAKVISQEIADLDTTIRDSNEDTLLQEKCRLSAEYEKMFKEIHNIDGNKKAVSDEIKKLQADLRSKDLRHADKTYSERFSLQKCRDIVAGDINKYYKALDTAIMRFHSDKMRSINEIIRDLWRNTYRGNDIDYIEIQTDETDSAGADKRRIYQYRVVMVKGDTEMDMRGRCSAGQKVLASLIIRMALAETFSFNCGILALDEPTTNLDADNVEALALALLNIVNSRRSQKNFQLIVITHDNSFLQRLAMADSIDYYYKVSRNDRGLSVIRRTDARDL